MITLKIKDYLKTVLSSLLTVNIESLKVISC